MTRKKQPSAKELPFDQCLVLNQWLILQCGHDPFTSQKPGKPKLRPLQGLAKPLKDCPEGMDTDNLHHFYKRLHVGWPQTATFTQADLLRYEQNIISHTLAINARRTRPIVWKYYQWLSLLFVEIYLERYFRQRHRLQASLNEFIQRFKDFWENQGFAAQIPPYTQEDLNKICLQNATGSGKTLLMHVNFLQFHHHAKASQGQSGFHRTLLITPNEELSAQHMRELDASGIRAIRLPNDSDDLLASGQNSREQIDFTEITKLADEEGSSRMAIRNLGVQNLLLVDEAHRGVGSTEEAGWFRRREQLVEKGFVFEYSATFKEAISAAKRPEMKAAYTKNILFDYSYRYFYEDGYGKDYRIFNLPPSYQALQFKYLTAALLSFYQQLKLYEDQKAAFLPYHLEKPLWVFVGKSVNKATSRDEKATVSDVARILQFLANFLQDESASAATAEQILGQNAQATGLLDESGHDIFAGSFSYLRDLKRQKDWEGQDLLRDLFAKVFLNASGGALVLSKIKGSENEIRVRVGHAEAPFGLINVGNADKLLQHIEAEKEACPADFHNLQVVPTEFSEPLFGKVHQSTSPVTLLLGSKKFVEGWDCWRVSTLGLMHVGKSEGSQIIQLFGRGVRLKGHGWKLKRSGFATPTHRPKHIEYLETLNVFGVQADFMARFKKFLQEEALPGNEQKVVHTVPLHITHDFGKKLLVLRPRKKDRTGREYDFKKDGKVPALGEIPQKLKTNPVVIDWYPRIQAMESNSVRKDGQKQESVFSESHWAFLDEADLFFRLEKFKRERAWHNLNLSQAPLKSLLLDGSWYRMWVPAQTMTENEVSHVFLWQEMAAELMQKYCEALYNDAKAAFTQPRLELRPLAKEDKNFPQERAYQLMVESSESSLIADILDLQKALQTTKKNPSCGDLKALRWEAHLYEPLLHVAKNSKIQIAPVSLNESEFQFVADLQAHLSKISQGAEHADEAYYLLRNESRGKGIGFFEAGNFYPDFLLWKLKEGRQCLAFIEPHGLVHEGPASRKIEFHQTIKAIEKRLASTNVCLNSFIVTPTRFSDLNWGSSQTALENENVLFMKDSPDYIARIVERMEL